MARLGNLITDISIDKSNDIWITGADIVKYDGSNQIIYNFENSGVPSNSPYYLDTRCISIDLNDDKWIGCATAPGLSDIGIFKIEGEYAQNSKTWKHQDFGLTGDFYETSKIYASPFGGEVLAFVTELNGGTGISPTPAGITGGYLFRYNEAIDKWTEVLSDYNWTHIYDIKAKGIDGDKYEYWIATEIGIIIIDGGSNRTNLSLLDIGNSISSVRILNKENSGLPSSIIYSLDFDENNNLWIGTENGLVFLDNEGKYKIWNNSNLALPNPAEITIVKSINNGQVFFTLGDGYRGNGNGIFYFNGDTLINYNINNSDIPDNNITEIVSFWKKSNNKETTYYPGELLITSLDDISLFNYITPHVYASSKEVGTKGWNFITHVPSDDINLSRVDKYSWQYPSWRTYQDLYLEHKHPGLDRRNLFISTSLEDLADGSAGEIEYWKDGEISDYFKIKKINEIPKNKWISEINGADNISNIPNLSVNIIGDLYVVGLSINSTDYINLGKKPDGSTIIVNNPNPTDGSLIPSELGLLVYYNKSGQLEGYNTIRGKSTYIYDIKTSLDNKSLYVLGGYKNTIEAGEFIYGNYPGGALGGGATGSAVGISNINSPNIQGATGEYPWLLSSYTGGTASPYYPSWYNIGNPGEMGLFIMEIDSNIGSETSIGGINLDNPYELREKYLLKDFRHFPTNLNNSNDIKGAKLDISKTNISISVNLESPNALLYTYSNELTNRFDTLGLKNILGIDKGNLENLGVHLMLDYDLNLRMVNSTNSGIEIGSSVKITNISIENGNGTILMTGHSNGSAFSFGNIEIDSTIIGSDYGYYILMQNDGTYIDSGISLNILDEESITSTSGNNKHYIFQVINNSLSNVFGEESGYIESNYGSTIITIDSTGNKKLLNTYEIVLDNISIPVKIDKAIVSSNYIHSSYYGASGDRSLLKIALEEGEINSTKNIFELVGIINNKFDCIASSNGDLFYAGTNIGIGGEIIIGFSESSILKPGKSMGSIISNAGTNPWKSANLHRDKKNMQIPLMSTVFFSNYDSDIFGKNEYQWILTNQKTGEELLDIKNSPYFIYTFSKEGLYTIYNSIKDANGNVYNVTKKAFVEVINHRKRRPEDSKPGIINSEDYGFPEKSTTKDSDFYRTSKDLENKSNEIEKNTKSLFGSGIFIKNNPDGTFNSD